MDVITKQRPELDPAFCPAVLWNRQFHAAIKKARIGRPIAISLEKASGARAVFKTEIFDQHDSYQALNNKFVERLIKFLLWQRGGHKITIFGASDVANYIRACYSASGARQFDHQFLGVQIFGHPIEVFAAPYEEAPEELDASRPLGRHWDGCRVGFDLGGSDRKCAAVKDGEVVFTEEVDWNPYTNPDPEWHFREINDSLKRAASHLPRVDAIGGSAAGVYVDNEVRGASLFRGISKDLFTQKVRPLFKRLKKEWDNCPFEIINDGEVTALAGSMALKQNSVLGLAMGTSQAAGFVDHEGYIKDWLNELAFAPIDYRDDAPRDEWSGDVGCGVQYFSQQSVARLAPKAGVSFSEGIKDAEKLLEVQSLMAKHDQKAEKIFKTIGSYLGYAVAHYADFYNVKHVLVLGRVMTGGGGELILDIAHQVLEKEFPALAKNITIVTMGEKDKRHGQAVAAASLPKLR